MARRANSDWSIDRTHNGVSHIVRDRATHTVIGGVTPFRVFELKGQINYLAVRVDGTERTFSLRFDACQWLKQGFDAGLE